MVEGADEKYEEVGWTLEKLREYHEECVAKEFQKNTSWNAWGGEFQKAVDRLFIAQSLGVEVKPSRKKQRGRGKKKKK